MSEAGDLDLLEAACREGGAIARQRFGADYKSWNKPGGSPVTEADLEIDACLRRILTAARPAYGWLSEESADDRTRLERDASFVVDPIDGTVAFLKRRPHFTICAAVVRDGAPVAGVVFNPMLDHLYKARLGGGAWRNDRPIQVGGRDRLDGCAMLGDRASLDRPPWPPMTVENRNSVAYRVALVAEGAFDATVSLTAKRDWDLAAAALILTEAGGRIADAHGQAMRFNRADTIQSGLIAAGPRLFGPIAALAAAAMRQ